MGHFAGNARKELEIGQLVDKILPGRYNLKAPILHFLKSKRDHLDHLNVPLNHMVQDGHSQLFQNHWVRQIGHAATRGFGVNGYFVFAFRIPWSESPVA